MEINGDCSSGVKASRAIGRYFDKKSHANAYAWQIDYEPRAREYNSTKELTSTTIEDILVRYEAEVSKTNESGRSKLHCLKTLLTHLGSTFINKLHRESIIDPGCPLDRGKSTAPALFFKVGNKSKGREDNLSLKVICNLEFPTFP